MIVRTDRIGDVILTLPLADVLRKRFPQAHIAMLIRRYTVELVEDAPSVDEILFYDDGDRLLPFSRVVTAVRAGRFDIVFHTYPRYRLALMTWVAGIPVRVGTGYRAYSFLFNKRVYEHRKDGRRHELQYNLNLLKTVGIDADVADAVPSITVKPEARDEICSLLQGLGVRKEEKIVLLHPGSGGSTRNWRPAHFAELGGRLAQIAGVRVIVTGGRGEAALVEEVRAAAGPGALAVAGTLNLRHFAALIQQAAVFVANSTGPLHIAAAVGTPVVGLFPQLTSLGVTRWGPLTERRTIFSPNNKPADCALCTGDPHTGCECMESISVDEVFHGTMNYLIG